MSTANGNRFTYITPDDHQRWLWFTHIYSPSIVILTGCLRLRRKYRRLGLDDALLLAAHSLYLAYWLLALFALINRLGKSENLASPLERAKTSKLLFTSRIILILVLCAVKASTIALIRTVFAADFKSIPLWFRSVLIVAVCDALFGSLLISAGCSPSSLLEAPYDIHDSSCPHNVARWVVLTTVESIFELLLIVPVVTTVWGVQFSLKTKLKVTAAFLCRFIIWIPIWLHASFYISFLRSPTSGAIDIVPIVVTEELWAAIALVSASLPLLLSEIVKLSTSGMLLDAAFLTIDGSRNMHEVPARAFNTNRSNNHNGESGNNATTSSELRDNDERDEDIVLRPAHDRGHYSTSVVTQSSLSAQSFSSIGGKSKNSIIQEISFETRSQPVVARTQMR